RAMQAASSPLILLKRKTGLLGRRTAMRRYILPYWRPGVARRGTSTVTRICGKYCWELPSRISPIWQARQARNLELRALLPVAFKLLPSPLGLGQAQLLWDSRF